MDGLTRPVGESEADAYVRGICFKTGPPRLIGAELEWLVHDLREPTRPVAPHRLAAAAERVGALPLRSVFTVEPGGQLELSSRPAESLTACVEELSADLALARAELRGLGLALEGCGKAPWYEPPRVQSNPRYNAMEVYYDSINGAGRNVMCRTASVQVCVDAGTEEPGPMGYGRRWRMAHLLGAVLSAAFANSPLLLGRPCGWRSSRQACYARMDPGRSLAPPESHDPRAAWAAYALNANVMFVRSDGEPWAVQRGLALRQWARSGLPRPVTADDVAYHLTTLFPPIRPRGHLELRMIDAQPGEDGWIVPLAVTVALFDDPSAAETAYLTLKGLGDAPGPQRPPRNALWRRAARRGLSDPELHAAAVVCFAAAREALPRLGASPRVTEAVDAFIDRYVNRGRCPADDLLDRVAGGTGEGARP
ncbi:ergothioneine biosynthesis glutamate--cysteine ligase EgtA [Streptomyces cinnamoneus]|uniref:Glutamate--cysteine ligase EgtA n=1 Tax=Streptomyces cinnamoneus TaxID=53446 RepID=A0A2G1XMY2_STRCJ|nr:ergothioneine biosynthesis glutamate--cysteine ligase EgtA [Streptomyces cinnamoneus]PHQ52509.1 ergothioneine biosynthesis glutamate--cysteine ligase EgtA [Streptomyces cinnamoneus]PPT16044.1 ergothioneine biosynthesis glutamate--cysteine ligase EgtA [Streptomyces cinnamoneus]